MNTRSEREAKRVEMDIWTEQLRRKAQEYRRQGLSAEQAEEKACNDIRREIIES